MAKPAIDSFLDAAPKAAPKAAPAKPAAHIDKFLSAPAPKAPAPTGDPGLVSSIGTGISGVWDAVRHPIRSAESVASGVSRAVSHPSDFIKDNLEPVAGVGMAALDTVGRKTGMGTLTRPGTHGRQLSEQEQPWIDSPYSQAKKMIREHPIQSALLAVPGARGVGKLAGETKLVKAASTAYRGAKAGGQKLFSPETITEDARDTATLHRAAHGIRRGEAAAEHYALERHQRVVGNATPEEQDALAKYVDTGGREGSAGVDRGGAKPPPFKKWVRPDMHAAADAMRGVYTRYRSRIENVMGTDGPKFIKDYYARMWANSPEEVEKAMQGHSIYGSKQGSGRNLKKRSIPTYQEGLDRGLVPKFRNPIDATNAYTDNMASYLATHDTINGMRKTGLAKWAREGSIPKGMVKLEGIGTEKTTVLPGATRALKRVLVADESVARVYNRTVGRGLEHGDFAGAYRGARNVSNAVSQVKLGLSAFHATVMGEEGMVSTFAKGLKRVSKGDIGGVADMAKSPGAAFFTARKGGNLRRAILDPDNAAFHLKGMDPRLVDQFQRAGGRVNMERFYGTQSASGGFYRSVRNGTLMRDVADSLRAVGKAPVKGSLELMGKVLDTVSAPIFKEYVPRMKAGAWASQMEQWLAENPEASIKDQQRYAEGLTNNIDNRFGELIQDNQFWQKAHFQVAQLLMLSPSWNFGTVREIGGGLAELPKSVRGVLAGKGVTDKTAYVGALATTFLIQNGIATYLHTGQMPEGQDWLAYRTGGTDKNGAPQRGLIPGYMKDVLAFGYNFPHNVATEVGNKANPALAMAGQLVSNKDHFDKPIYNPTGGVPEQAGEAASYVGDQLKPISLSQPDRGPGDGFSKAETAAGIRQAPAYLEDPERKAALDKKYGDRAWKAKLKADRKQANRSAAAASDAPIDSFLDNKSSSSIDSFLVSPAKASTADDIRMKPGAMEKGAAFRPEFKPVVKLVEAVPGIRELTAGNDSYHPVGDVHADGRAGDFNLQPGANHAEVAARIRAKLKAAGIKATVSDEYASPSARATAGHIHVSIPRG